MRHRVTIVLALAALALPAAALLALLFPAAGRAAPDAEGIWLTEKERAAVKLQDCRNGGALCGTVWWLEPGGLARDKHNPDPAERDRPMCGREVMWGFQKNGGREWDGGELYKPDEGEIYNAYLKLKDDDRLKVSGYIGFKFLSKSQTWTRTSADAHPKCEPPEGAPAAGSAKPSASNGAGGQAGGK